MRKILLFIIILTAVGTAFCNDVTLMADSTKAEIDTINRQRLNILQKVIKYFDDANKPSSTNKVDFSVIGGPAYSNDTKLSLGILGAALYTSGADKANTSQSNASIYTVFSTTGFYNIGIRGVHFTPNDTWRLNYRVSFFSMPTYFWGIGYDTEKRDYNKTKFLQLDSKIRASFEYQLFNNCYIGPAINFNFCEATNAKDYALWEGQHLSTFSYGAGINILYDNRDCITAPHTGWFVSAEQRFYPRFLFNKYPFSSTNINISHYFGAWRDAVIAMNLHGFFTYGDTPWGMLPFLGGSETMRGYYEGRYRDKNAVDATIELRQHVWRRNSIVVWGGAGCVFPDFKNLRTRKILPNFGVGYRWEFKKNVNVRFDIGFGKGESGLVFNINEAF